MFKEQEHLLLTPQTSMMGHLPLSQYQQRGRLVQLYSTISNVIVDGSEEVSFSSHFCLKQEMGEDPSQISALTSTTKLVEPSAESTRPA